MIPGPVGGQFNVFIECPRSAEPGAAAQLANAIAARYGIPAAEVERRLAIGRFRVKGNVDKPTADTFAADLVRLGAVVTIASIDAPPPAALPVTPVSLQQPRVAAPRPAAPKPAAPPPKPAAPSPYTSGLSAAAGAGDLEEPGLGALSGEFPLTLSTLDGADDASVGSGGRAAVLPASFGPPRSAMGAGPPADFNNENENENDNDDVDVAMDDDEDDLGIDDSALDAPLPASIGPAAGVTALGERSRPTGPASGPVGADIFAPPETAAEQLALEVDESPERAKRRTAPPPAAMSDAMSAAQTSSGRAPARPSDAPAPGPPPPDRASGEPAWKTHARDVRVQYVAGVLLASALALIPATVIAAIREDSAFAELDGKLQDRESQVLTRADWDGLDRIRASYAERKRAERQSIAFTSLLIWAACAGGLAYVWFRVIDWDRVLGPEPRPPS